MNISRDLYYAFDQPIPYKELTIYPIKMRDFYLFNYLSSCLLLEKNSIKDPQMAIKAISMTYLEYLFFMANDENGMVNILDGLLRLVLNKKDDMEFKIYYLKGKDGRPLIRVGKGKTLYDSSDFDELRKLIAEQNELELPDETIQKDVREKMEEARRLKRKLNNTKVASLEEQIVALGLYSGWSMTEIYDMTIRKFFMAVKRASHMIMSNIYLSAHMTGFVKFKDKSVLQTWLVDLNSEDKYSDVKIDPEVLAKKASFESATIK